MTSSPQGYGVSSGCRVGRVVVDEQTSPALLWGWASRLLTVVGDCDLHTHHSCGHIVRKEFDEIATL